MLGAGWFRDTFELSRGGASGDVRSMEGMRGLAVTAVFFVHYTTFFLPYATQTSLAPFMGALHQMGNAGVDLFFVLSGYLIYAAALKRPPYAQFMARRIRRIYPTFLAVLSVYLVLLATSHHESKMPSGVWNSLAYVVENVLLIPGFFPIKPIITVAWSLSYEMVYYLVIPVLVMALGLNRWRRRNRITLFVALAAVGIVVSSIAGGPVRAVMFFGGVILYDIRDKKASLPFIAPLALTAAFASMLIATGTHRVDDAIHVAVMFVAIPLFCFACFSKPDSVTTRGLSARPLRWLGNMSYSYYLLHGLALQFVVAAVMHLHAPTGHDATLVIVLMLPAYLLTIAACAALFIAIERPLSLRERKPNLAGIAIS